MKKYFIEGLHEAEEGVGGAELPGDPAEATHGAVRGAAVGGGHGRHQPRGHGGLVRDAGQEEDENVNLMYL